MSPQNSSASTLRPMSSTSIEPRPSAASMVAGCPRAATPNQRAGKHRSAMNPARMRSPYRATERVRVVPPEARSIVAHPGKMRAAGGRRPATACWVCRSGARRDGTRSLAGVGYRTMASGPPQPRRDVPAHVRRRPPA
jgi:hypothetical protein